MKLNAMVRQMCLNNHLSKVKPRLTKIRKFKASATTPESH